MHNPLSAAARANRAMIEQYGRSDLTFYPYLIMRIVSWVLLVYMLIKGEFSHAGQAAAALVLFCVPPFFERKAQADLPKVFLFIILCFIFSFLILGEIFEFMGRIFWWDTMLHTSYGFIFAAFSFSLLEVFNKDTELKFRCSKVYVILTTMSITMFFGTLWEFAEYAADQLLGFDMQKDRLVDHFQSTFLDETHMNVPIPVKDIESTVINLADGNKIVLDGYLDIGIWDTMKDHFVAFAGAAVFCIFLVAYLKTKGNNKLAATLVPVRHDWKAEPPVVRAALAKKLLRTEKTTEDKEA
ncbi:MAG: hypothetical protein II473_04060 [Clostridia bacterium]|nr:hypothetical protein [Clostridia bacterium]MBQ2092341.1 hypothetical protein [Clostridia bacterium]